MTRCSPRSTAAVDPDAIQFNGREPASTIAASARPAWKALHVAADGAGAAGPRRDARARWLASGSSGSWSIPQAARIPAGPGVRADASTAAAIAREVPITLAGGLSAANVGRGASDDPGGRGRRRVRRRTAARPGRAPGQGPGQGRAVREARQGRTRRSPEPALRPVARPCRPARGRRRGSLGHGAGLRRPLRARDADGGARPARVGLRRPAPGPRLLGRPPRAARALRRPADADLPGGSPGCGGTLEAARLRSPTAGRPTTSPPSVSTSSARTSPTPGRTRSTTPSARRC